MKVETCLNRRRGQAPVVGQAHATPPTSSFLANLEMALVIRHDFHVKVSVARLWSCVSVRDKMRARGNDLPKSSAAIVRSFKLAK